MGENKDKVGGINVTSSNKPTALTKACSSASKPFKILPILASTVETASMARKRQMLIELRRADHEVHDIVDGRYDGQKQKYQQGMSR